MAAGALADLPAGSRVVVAMSGGVDSSVTAALLAEAGYEVVGVTLQLYDHGAASGRKGACCAGRDIQDAREVAGRLGIAHYVLDFEARFRAAVIDDFARTYAEGRTPVPCVRCNERIKFTDLLGIARELGRRRPRHRPLCAPVSGPSGPELHRAADPAKDQSYFLFATTREQLAFLRFPLGDLTRPRCAPTPSVSACRSPTSPTARTSASCPTATTATWWPGCGPMRSSPATSSTSTAASWAATPAPPASRSASGAASRSPTASALRRRHRARAAPRRRRPAPGRRAP